MGDEEEDSDGSRKLQVTVGFACAAAEVIRWKADLGWKRGAAWDGHMLTPAPGQTSDVLTSPIVAS